MDVDICQSCGEFLRQRLRFCTCCGNRLTHLSPTTMPKISASLDTSLAASLVDHGSSLGASLIGTGAPSGTFPILSSTPTLPMAPTADLRTSVRLSLLGLQPMSDSADCTNCSPEHRHGTKDNTSNNHGGATADSVSRRERYTARSGKTEAAPATKFDGKAIAEQWDTLYKKLKDVVHEIDSDTVLSGISSIHKAVQQPDPGKFPKHAFIVAGVVLVSLLFVIIGGTSVQKNYDQIPSLDGRWSFRANDFRTSRSYTSSCVLFQEGTRLTGVGQESGMRFSINGNVYFPRVQFVKTFLDVNAPDVSFQGIVDSVDGHPTKSKFPLHMQGNWWMQGTILDGSEDQRWEAMPQGGPAEPESSSTTNMMNTARIAKHSSGPLPSANQPQAWATFFMQVAGGLLLLGIGLVVFSAKLFGPSGMLNIWAKKEYIPSQFRSQHNKVLKQFGKPLEANGLPLGLRNDWSIFKFWQPKVLALPADVREANPHMLLVGAGSKGKSRLLANMIAHDIQSENRSVVVVDSDGSLVDLIASWISAQPNAKQIASRVIIVDPIADTTTLTYNPLEMPPDGNIQSVASALVFGFKAIYTEPPGSQSQWTQQTADILRNAATLLMVNGRTLVDLPTLLNENDFRDVLLEGAERMTKERPELVSLLEAWSRYKKMARTEQWINWIEPILNRVNPMLADPRIRPILTSTKGDINLRTVLTENKILLVKVPQGHLDQNANLLGSLLVTGLKQAALVLHTKNASHAPCSLYLDDFDHFIEKETFVSITSETRKYGIAFIGATKTLQGLPEDYRNQMTINVGTLCCFALGKKDGDLLGPQMFRVDGRKIKHQTLQNIFNRVNTTPQFELITDEEKLNIDRVVGQEERTYFCYQVGTIAGVFQIRAHDFDDIRSSAIDWDVHDAMYFNKASRP